MKQSEILVIGGGAWGTTLANILAENNPVDLLVLDSKICEEINTHHTNKAYFKVKLNKQIKAINQIPDSLINYQMIVLAVPAVAILQVANTIKSLPRSKNLIVVNGAKGFEPNTNQVISSALKQVFTREHVIVGAIMGPGFANELIKKQVTAVNAISDDLESAKKIQAYFATDYFRVYTSTDLIGAEIAGALKNVIAIASGIIWGAGYRHNTRAALITRGLKEMIDYAMLFNCQVSTFFGLSGIGDLTLTCSTKESRNFKLGYQIGKNNSASILDSYPYTVEGVNTTRVIYHSKTIDMPILEAIYQVLFEQALPKQVLTNLMKRELKKEFESNK